MNGDALLNDDDHESQQSVDPPGLRPSHFTTRESDTLYSDEMDEDRLERKAQVHKAAIYIQDAFDGTHRDLQLSTRFKRRCYHLHHKWLNLFRMCALGLVLLTFFERPLWTYRDDFKDKWDNDV